MARIVISDSSVLMDLAIGRLLEATPKLPFRFEIPDVMFTSELLDLGDYTRDQLVEFGFRIGTLEGDGVIRAFSYFQEYRTLLSERDCFALVLAEERKAILMSGDRRLREISEVKGVEVHGVLWIADLILEHRVLSASALAKRLEKLSRNPRCRLPKKELMKRITAWRSST